MTPEKMEKLNKFLSLFIKNERREYLIIAAEIQSRVFDEYYEHEGKAEMDEFIRITDESRESLFTAMAAIK